MKIPRYVVILAAAVVVIGSGAAGYVAWEQYEASLLPVGIVSINGRVEATQVDISTKIPGRVTEIVPHEGDMVSPGEVVARIDTSETGAQLHQAQASASSPAKRSSPVKPASQATMPNCNSPTKSCGARRRWSTKDGPRTNSSTSATSN
jgi:HlyD family secretion protein